MTDLDKPAAEESLTTRQSLLNEIGRKLREAREARGESVDEPARLLKLSKGNLQALESGNWDMLPDEVYALGFLRQYSQHLQIDISHEMELLKNDQYKLTKPLTFPDPPVAPSRRWAWISGGAFILLFILFNILNRDSSDVEFAENLSSSSYETVQDEQKPAEKSPVEMQVKKPTEITVKQNDTAAINTEVPAVAEKIAPPAPVVTAKVKPQPAATKTHLYRFEAVTGDVWLQVYGPDESGNNKGKLLREALLKQGYHANVKSRSESLWITCGNALALRIKVDGKLAAETGALSRGKKILRDHHFSISND